MQAFEFNTVNKIIFQQEASTRLNEYAAKQGILRPLIVTDPGIIEHGLLNGALKSFDHAPMVFSDVQADPPEHVVLNAVEQAKSQQCDGVIGYGGGSSMDVAKLVAALIPATQGLSDMYGVDQISGDRLPLIQVPTTAGTGSEATNVAIVTTGESTKAGVVSKQLYADLIILDATLTLGLPRHVTAATGIDAMVHAIEAYTSKRLKNPMSDMVALKSLKLMSDNITTAANNGSDLNARSNMLYGAMLAGQAFSNAPVGAVHALAYPLGGVFHIPHGLSNSLVLPEVLKFNGSSAEGLYSEIASVVISEEVADSAESSAESLSNYFHSLSQDLDLQTKLSQFDIPESSLADLAEQAMLQQRLLINNPRELDYNDALKIYQAAY